MFRSLLQEKLVKDKGGERAGAGKLFFKKMKETRYSCMISYNLDFVACIPVILFNMSFWPLSVISRGQITLEFSLVALSLSPLPSFLPFFLITSYMVVCTSFKRLLMSGYLSLVCVLLASVDNHCTISINSLKVAKC